MRIALLCLLLAGACGERNFNRAALVPRATPRMTSGQPLEGRGQLSLGASSVAHLGDPEIGDDPNAGVEIPGTQLFGALKGRLGQHASFGILYENGLDQGAKKLNKSQPDVDGGNVQGYGLTFDIAIPVDDKWTIGLGLDAMMWSVPYTSYEVFNGTITIRDEGSDSVGTFAASITPSYKLDEDLALFGGFTVRQHPTIQQKGMDIGTVLDDVEVDSGPANYIVSAGVEGSLLDGSVLLMAVGYYDLSRDPAKYGPGMGLMVSLPFGRRPKTPPQQQAPGMIYTPMYAPPAQPYPPQPYPPQPYPPQPYPPQPYPPQPPAPVTPAPQPIPAPAAPM
jgi:hypothetical protein